MKNKNLALRRIIWTLIFACVAASAIAGYKARPWKVNAREEYPASLTSEGVTIAASPLFTDALAAQVFDNDDILTRGIMPLAIVIFNDNDYPVEVDAMSIQLIRGEDRLRTLSPGEAVSRLYGKSNPLTGQPSGRPPNEKALEDFEDKSLLNKRVEAHGKGGGFLYVSVRNIEDLPSYLSSAIVYIPNVFRQDTGSRLIFFEINLNVALPSSARDNTGNARHGQTRP